MAMDLYSVTVMAALVVNVSAVVFILETVIRRDEGASRVWTLAFLAGMVASIAYVAWAYDRSQWWAVATGNAAFVAATALMWLGSRTFNGRRGVWAPAAVGVGVLATAGAALAAGPDGGDWAGAAVMFMAIVIVAGLGCAECLRGAMRAARIAGALAAVLGLQSGYFLLRTIALVTAGPDSVIFQTWFSTVTASFLTVTFTVVSLVAASVLRAGRTPVRGLAELGRAVRADGGIVPAAQFDVALRGLLTRAAWRDELVAVLAVAIEDLDQIASAFGGEVARDISDAWRAGVRRHLPAAARIGGDGAHRLVAATVVASPAEAHRIGTRLARGLFEDLRAVPGSVLPVIGVGVALTDVDGNDADALLVAARRESARREPVAHSAHGLDPAGA
ncbi:hypothetical protein GCM10022240_22170 [Microbacterium kribbense]|uniref:GGDEF domain-containing protein n=1 Tax=Microbacterium kribbense TaxID=433645 RepID=A0ABP7GNK2_9MICO